MGECAEELTSRVRLTGLSGGSPEVPALFEHRRQPVDGKQFFQAFREAGRDRWACRTEVHPNYTRDAGGDDKRSFVRKRSIGDVVEQPSDRCETAPDCVKSRRQPGGSR